MILGYTETELRARSLFPLFRRGTETPSHFINVETEHWDGDEDSFLQKIGDPVVLEQVEVYQRCQASVRLGNTNCFFPIAHFKHNGKKKLVWDTEVTTVRNSEKSDKSKEIKERNMPILRMYATGSEEGRIHCALQPEIRLDEVCYWKGGLKSYWVQHHIRFYNRISVHKGTRDPGNILKSIDFTKPSQASRIALLDLAATTFVNPMVHDNDIHSVPHGDIDDYQTHELPWALQSKENWESFNQYLFDKYGHPKLAEYDAWIQAQRN